MSQVNRALRQGGGQQMAEQDNVVIVVFDQKDAPRLLESRGLAGLRKRFRCAKQRGSDGGRAHRPTLTCDIWGLFAPGLHQGATLSHPKTLPKMCTGATQRCGYYTRGPVVFPFLKYARAVEAVLYCKLRIRARPSG